VSVRKIGREGVFSQRLGQSLISAAHQPQGARFRHLKKVAVLTSGFL
jgi:hypothetical protein